MARLVDFCSDGSLDYYNEVIETSWKEDQVYFNVIRIRKSS